MVGQGPLCGGGGGGAVWAVGEVAAFFEGVYGVEGVGFLKGKVEGFRWNVGGNGEDDGVAAVADHLSHDARTPNRNPVDLQDPHPLAHPSPPRRAPRHHGCHHHPGYLEANPFTSRTLDHHLFYILWDAPWGRYRHNVSGALMWKCGVKGRKGRRWRRSA